MYEVHNHPQSGWYARSNKIFFMSEEKKETIMYDSPEAAIYRTDIKGWVSADRIFFGDGESGERAARYRSATHIKCKCGAVIPNRTYLSCESCRHKAARENYLKKQYKEYDGSYVVDWDGDKYFWDEGEIIDYLEENELESIDLLFCEPIAWRIVDNDYWSDEMSEDSDGELPKKMQEALDNLNKIISEQKPQSYQPGKFRTTYKLYP